MKKVLYLLLIILCMLAIAFIARNFYQYRQLSKTRVTSEKGIDRLFYLDIRGQKTGVLARGNDLSNPILLMIHGGPGYPDMMLGRCYDEGLLNEFTVVRYDQRGVGKSRSANLKDAQLSIDNFTQDLLALTDALKANIPNVDVYLIGHSWGTVLGIKAAHQAPDKFKAYIGMGQIVHQQKADSISYEYCLKKAEEYGDKEALKILNKMDATLYSSSRELLSQQREILQKYKGSSYQEGVRDELKQCVLQSPEMSILEVLTYQSRGREMDQKIFPQLLEVDFFTRIEKLELPVFFFGGRHDFHVPSVLAESYLNQLEAPQKDFYWFEESGHLPIYEENEKFAESLIEIKTSLAQQSP
ncbi:MAG: alpha/beta hydrolase [Bacteroidota bacterium]